MINLLPYDIRKQLKAARLNNMLIRYLVLILITAIFIAIICAISFLLIENSRPKQQSAVVSITESNPETYENSLIEFNKIKNNIKIAQEVIAKQTSFSEAMLEISDKLPKDSILENIKITNGSQVELTILAKESNITDQISTAFQNSNKLTNFSISSNETNKSTNSNYSIKIKATATLNRG